MPTTGYLRKLVQTIGILAVSTVGGGLLLAAGVLCVLSAVQYPVRAGIGSAVVACTVIIGAQVIRLRKRQRR